MTDLHAEPDEGLGEGDAEASRKRRKLSGKRLTLFVILPAVVLLGGGAGAYFGGLAEPLLSRVMGAGEHEAASKPAVFYDLPELLVNLNQSGKKASFLKLKVALEIADPEAAEQLDAVLPRIIDNFQVYLRELRLDDLNGSAGLFRLKEELLVRVNAAVKPIRINDVLFKEMIVQ